MVVGEVKTRCKVQVAGQKLRYVIGAQFTAKLARYVRRPMSVYSFNIKIGYTRRQTATRVQIELCITKK